MEVAEFLCSYCRVFVPLLKSRFFVIYFRGVTLADEKPPSDEGGGFCEAKDGGREQHLSPSFAALSSPLVSGGLCPVEVSAGWSWLFGVFILLLLHFLQHKIQDVLVDPHEAAVGSLPFPGRKFSLQVSGAEVSGDLLLSGKFPVDASQRPGCGRIGIISHILAS
jgi:hypothetical protein